MSAACTAHIPLHRLPAHVRIVRHDRPGPAAPPANRPGARSQHLFLERNDEIRVSSPATFTFSYATNQFRISDGRVRLSCRHLLLDSGVSPPSATVLAVELRSGRVQVRAGPLARRALVLSPEMLALATSPGTDFVVERNPHAETTRAWTLDKPIVAARGANTKLRIRSQITYTAISDRRGLRLDVWPFPIMRAQRATGRADRLVRFWADGRQCSVGCAAPGGKPGWPIRPFHQQHAIRAGLNELRPANFHIGIDIEADNGQAVYPIQSGFVQIIGAGTPDEHVQVGQFQYWHLNHRVHEGEFAVAYRTELGTIKYDFKHVHVSELGPAGQYLNPLRPGRMLAPYTDTEAPVIGSPRIFRDGRVIVSGFDPQSFVRKTTYRTPVLAPAALAWRLFDARGRPVTQLEWALRGSQNYPPSLKPVIFAPGALNPGYGCFAYRIVCIPNWTYWLAGGLSERLPLAALPRGRYRMSVYAWDWAGNSSALDHWLSVPLRSAAPAPDSTVVAAFDYQ